jgi:hypothetical protein
LEGGVRRLIDPLTFVAVGVPTITVVLARGTVDAEGVVGLGVGVDGDRVGVVTGAETAGAGVGVGVTGAGVDGAGTGAVTGGVGVGVTGVLAAISWVVQVSLQLPEGCSPVIAMKWALIRS